MLKICPGVKTCKRRRPCGVRAISATVLRSALAETIAEQDTTTLLQSHKHYSVQERRIGHVQGFPALRTGCVYHLGSYGTLSNPTWANFASHLRLQTTQLGPQKDSKACLTSDPLTHDKEQRLPTDIPFICFELIPRPTIVGVH
jgi:hypothetical protein